MGVLPIGFFSPLPLAIMIPFMATQSLAMGEAFGKSFQYGKRKISSMTNEEFNAYTFSNMMDEQTANVREYIPKLHEQMELSYKLQIDIFQEMVKIIPAFFEALMRAFNQSDLAEQFREFNTTPFNEQIPRSESGGILVSASGAPDITEISHSQLTPEIEIIEKPDARNNPTTQDKLKYQQFAEQTTDATIQANKNVLYSLPNWQKSIINAQWNLRGLNPKNKTIEKSFTITIPKETRQQEEFVAWTKQRDALIKDVRTNIDGYQYWNTQAAMLKQGRGTGNTITIQKQLRLYQQRLQPARTALTRFQQTHARNPNPLIQRSATLLRRQLDSILRTGK